MMCAVETDEWGASLLTDDTVNIQPKGLRIRCEIGEDRALENITNDINRFGARIEVVDDSPIRALRAYLPVDQEIGLDFDIPPSRQPLTFIDDDGDPDFSGRYPRYMAGFAKRVGSTSDPGVWEREEAVEVADYTILLDEAPRQPSQAYPPGDGTPYVYTRTRASISVGSNTVRPDSMRNIYAGKYLYASNPNGTNQERFSVTSVNYTGNTTVAAAVATTGSTVITPASMTGITNGKWLHVFNVDGTGAETVQAGTITGTTFTATLSKKKRANWIIMAGEFTATFTTTKTYSTTTVASGIAHGTRVVTPASMTNIAVGQYLTVHNDDGKSQEVVEVLAVTGSTFTALFTTDKTDDWVVSALPIIEGGISDLQLLADGWYQDISGELTYVESVFDYFYNRSESTGVTSGISAGANQTITPASIRNIFAPRILYCVNTDGTNGEEVVVESVLGGSFVADFTLSKSANWLVYNGYYIDKNGIGEILPSLPHMQWGRDHGETVRDIILAVANNATPIDTTVAGTVTAGSNIWVTPASMYGISIGKKLRVKNADGTGAEVVEVEDVTLTTFRADYTSNKTANWVIRGEVAPLFSMPPLQDSPDHTALWTPQAKWVDGAAYTTRTDLNLIDAAAIDPDTEASYYMYEINRDEYQKVNAADVRGSNNAFGSYVHMDDVTDDEGPARIIKRRALDRPDLFTNAECDQAARQFVLANLDTRVSYVVETLERLEPNILREFMTTSFTNSKETETTPATVPIYRPQLTFPDGLPHWHFELGAPIFARLDDTPEVRAERPVPVVDPDPLTEVYTLDTDTDLRLHNYGGWNKSFLVDAISDLRYITLPPAAEFPTATFRFKRKGDTPNSVFVTPQDGDYIDEAEYYELAYENQAVELQSDGVDTWQVMSTANAPASNLVGTVWASVGDRVNVLSTGVKTETPVHFSGVFASVTVLADQVGDVVVDILKTDYGTYPTATSICGTNKPEITADQKYLDTVLTDWDTGISAGDILIFEIESASDITHISVALEVRTA